ncbi:phosphohydrolase [Rhodoferax koreense]|uniref:Phosphohydrolase n=1 Tax=Rhodoferax koreensis TaxID=1842727 RepID=A0A1P8JU19_9BURK|nr:HD domain-containing phosphohydrolase [Rhodoferax koreense]APW37243.1 phosphohydrolase [Rhodoferax koreense]
MKATTTETDELFTACKFDEAAARQMEQFIADFGQMYRERNQALREVALAHHQALLQLAVAADFRDDDTGVHIVRIGFLAEALALKLGQSLSFARMLRKAAPMHDIGKIGTPDCVLKKPGSLSAEERSEMNRHPVIGAEILGRSRIALFQLAAEVALTHHERFDGRGYPAGLVGHAIPLSGRITSVVDFYDALTMDRCYRPAFNCATALEMLQAERGGAFDPEIVDTFVAHAAELEEVRRTIDRKKLTFQALIDAN